ncbi:SEC14-like protein 2 isoform X4 [Bombus vancouverensis nearcticus]|uniref:SEC14-like protein 2 isoform X4 n=1 Tax=Bombus vancouverensis nearcticus TaxID=2705178 RepID=UPI00402BAE31
MLKVVGLEDNQRFALMKFRRTVQDILKQPHHDDNFLLRWLRARKWDPVAAEKMLRESMEWRKQWEVDKLTEWDPPQILNDYLPHGLCGFDKDGAPAGEVVITLIQMYEANYPEILKTCYIINAPKVFAFAFSVTKKFMNEYTLSKIQIYKSDPARWQTAIFSNIDRDQVPAFFGGTLKDPDGNPKLGTKICLGGKVPKEMYVNNTEKDMENFTTVTIKKGGKLELDIPASEMGSLLSWEFRTENHDIRFGIVKKDYNGTQKEVIPMRRVAAHQLDEIGILTCEVPSTYSIIFDNTYSIIRNKKIHYSVKVIPPTESQEITPTTL